MSANNDAANNPKIFKTPFQLARLMGNQCVRDDRRLRQQDDKIQETGKKSRPCYSLEIANGTSQSVYIIVSSSQVCLAPEIIPRKRHLFHECRNDKGVPIFVKLEVWKNEADRVGAKVIISHILMGIVR